MRCHEELRAAIHDAKPPHVREFTPRSVAVGLLVALVIGASYPYVVLKFGFGPNISVVSAFFGFLALGLFSKNYNRWENNIVQTAGTTAGQIAFLCWLLAAFDMLAAEPGSGFDVHLTRMQTFVWLTASGLLGVLLAVPLRKHFIVDENLPFPDGIAAGETLIVLDSRGRAGAQVGLRDGRRARRVRAACSSRRRCSGSWTRFRSPSTRSPPRRARLRRLAAQHRLGHDHRPAHQRQHADRRHRRVGAGAAVAAVAGMLAADARRVDILLWVMWPAVGHAGRRRHLRAVPRVARPGHDVPVAPPPTATCRRLPAALGLDRAPASSVLLVVGAGVLLRHAGVALGRWRSLLSVPLGARGLRVLGETNWGPISTMTNVMQAIFGGHRARATCARTWSSSGITGAVAAESEGLMQDFRAGQQNT